MGRRWLCARPPLVGGMNRRATRQGVSCSAADHRILTAVVFMVTADSGASDNSGVSDSTCFSACVATGASDASVTLLGLSTRDHRWLQVAQLWHHHCPVISMAHLQRCRRPGSVPYSPNTTPNDPGSQQHLLLSGATDGGIAVWDVSPAVAATRSSSIASDSAAVDRQVPTILPATVDASISGKVAETAPISWSHVCYHVITRPHSVGM